MNTGITLSRVTGASKAAIIGGSIHGTSQELSGVSDIELIPISILVTFKSFPQSHTSNQLPAAKRVKKLI